MNAFIDRMAVHCMCWLSNRMVNIARFFTRRAEALNDKAMSICDYYIEYYNKKSEDE